MRNPFPEVTGLTCRVPSKIITYNLSILYLTTCVGFYIIIACIIFLDFKVYYLFVIIYTPTGIKKDIYSKMYKDITYKLF